MIKPHHNQTTRTETNAGFLGQNLKAQQMEKVVIEISVRDAQLAQQIFSDDAEFENQGGQLTATNEFTFTDTDDFCEDIVDVFREILELHGVEIINEKHV